MAQRARDYQTLEPGTADLAMGAGMRRLEIGPGKRALSGFETLDIDKTKNPNYWADAGGPLPIADETFDFVYASHVLEHIPWYQTEGALAEWVRILKSGGKLEVWVPDAAKIAKALLADAEVPEKWCKYNAERDVCKWAAGRTYAYGPEPNWHKALFNRRYLRKVLRNAGLVNLYLPGRPWGADHGWINLGAGGQKP
jgi:SAM-dependent methyltransferase